MKKLTIATLISTALSTMAFAGDDMEKIHSSFANLDKDGNGYISRAEAKDSDIFAHFTRIDKNADTQLSMKEFDAHIERYPQHFDGDVVSSARAAQESIHEEGTMETYVAVDSEIDEQVSSVQDKKMTHELQATTEPEVNEKVIEKEIDVKAEKTVVAESKFEMMDSNNDGELTKAEASRSGVTRDFDDIDSNNDELITRIEYTQYQSMKNDSEE